MEEEEEPEGDDDDDEEEEVEEELDDDVRYEEFDSSDWDGIFLTDSRMCSINTDFLD